jgi:hypothetical protein
MKSKWFAVGLSGFAAWSASGCGDGVYEEVTRVDEQRLQDQRRPPLECLFELGDCDGKRKNGCETPLLFDSRNCGACENVCGAGFICEDGACLELCEQNLQDCDGDTNNLCETDITTDPNNCGDCGVSCRGHRICVDGECRRPRSP